jgi:hypothetical protein
MQNIPEDQNILEDIVLRKSLYRDHLIEVLEGDGDYWFQCRSVHGGEEETGRAGYNSPGSAERAGKVFIDRKIENGNTVSNLEIKWPWAMLPLSVADEYIKYLQERIDSEHPLYGKKVFPSCIREDSQDPIIQFDLDDDNSYAIVFFGEKRLFGNKKMPRVEIIASVSELQKRFDQDHRNAIESLDD